MTENEVIKTLTLSEAEKKRFPMLMPVYEMAIKALEEVQQYRAIGTVEECRAAVEKQTARVVIDNIPTDDDVWYQCPACKADLTHFRGFYCQCCGQKLKWGDEG